MRYLVLLVALLVGCATQPQNPPPKISDLNTCGDLRDERARVVSIADAALTLPPLYAQNVRTKARMRLSKVNQKAADLGCRRGFR